MACAASGAGILDPGWSRPLAAEVVSSAVRGRQDGTDELFLLLADRSVVAVSRTDTLTMIGKAPAGTRAIAGIPCSCAAVAPVPCSSRPAILLAGPELVAWNRAGSELWRRRPGPLAGCDSMGFMDWRDGEPRLLVCGKTGLFVVTIGDETLTVDTVAPGLHGCHAVVFDTDADGTPEVCATDGRRLLIEHPDENRHTDVSWPAAPRTSSPALAIADPDRCGRPQALVIVGDTLRCIDPTSGRQRWAAGAGLPGVPLAVAANDGPAFVTGIDSGGRCWLAAVKRDGVVEPVLYPPLPAGTLPIALSMLGDWPLLSVRADYGAENIHTCSPSLAPGSFGSAGFSGARLRRVVVAQFDDDTFADLVVVRTAGDVPLRVDLFTNRMGAIVRDLAEAHASLSTAVVSHDAAAVRRASRRIELINAEINPGMATTETERSLLARLHCEARMRLLTRLAAVAGALAAAAGLFLLSFALLRRRRAGPPGRQVENKPLPVRVALAADLVALDHNFVAKGNHTGALARFVEIRQRHGLGSDRDLARLEGDISPAYRSLITRLIDGTETVNLLELVEKTARRAIGDRPFEVVEMNRERFRQELLAYPPADQPAGVRLVLTSTRESRGIHTRLRWFSSPELISTLEHIVIDHINYADTWAAIVLDYTVSTQWNRRAAVILLSDSSTGIDFDRPHGHINSQLVELASALRPAIEVPGPGFKPVAPHEKLWLSCHDYISVLEEARSRLDGVK